MLLCSPPTPCPLQPRLRFPLPATYLVAGACSMPTWADDTCTRIRVVRRRPLTGSPQHRGFFEERRGPPRLLDRPLRACYGRTPRRIQVPSSPRKKTRVANLTREQYNGLPFSFLRVQKGT